MAVRPIDAVQVLKDINWHHKPTPVSEFESGVNQGLNQAMWIITHAPTLTPPNEPLTIEQLREMGGQPYWHVGLREESSPPHWNILDPFYAKHIEDYRYGENWLAYRRPPEGEEHCYG